MEVDYRYTIARMYVLSGYVVGVLAAAAILDIGSVYFHLIPPTLCNTFGCTIHGTLRSTFSRRSVVGCAGGVFIDYCCGLGYNVRALSRIQLLLVMR